MRVSEQEMKTMAFSVFPKQESLELLSLFTYLVLWSVLTETLHLIGDVRVPTMAARH